MTPAQLTGRDSAGLVDSGGGRLLLPAAAAAFAALRADARAAGFDLRIVSAYRSFDRQLHIFNRKVRGELPVVDDADRPVDIAALNTDAALAAVLRFSALPGASRHHWGTDMDVYDAAAVSDDYDVALSAAEVAPGGVFDAMHCWLDARIAAGESHGFYRPYAADRGGVAPERWHLSFAPLARPCEEAFSAELLGSCWSDDCAAGLCWRDALVPRLPALVDRYVHNVASPPFPVAAPDTTPAATRGARQPDD